MLKRQGRWMFMSSFIMSIRTWSTEWNLNLGGLVEEGIRIPTYHEVDSKKQSFL